MKLSNYSLNPMGKISFAFLVVFIFLFENVEAQYFGRNKPRYETFDFKVLETPTFEIYHYLENKGVLHDLAQKSEHWYQVHQQVLKDTFSKKNPLVFYCNHADFQQTNTISGRIGIGTGGVTEGLKNRVVMPLAFSNQQTNHVLGHELVHAFQYHMIIKGDSTNIRSLQNLPLWMVEGLAEYLSIGKVDAHTAMWMRDAILNDDFPGIKDLSNPKYFPYRYGQAFWAFIAGYYGDDMIERLFMNTAQYGMEAAVDSLLGINVKTLSGMWKSATETHFKEIMQDAEKENFIGKKLLSEKNAGRMNVSPTLSPDGKYVIFLSEKNLFSLDLFLADARTGEVIRNIASAVRDGHLDAISGLESAGTWSPDSKQFAFVAFAKGKNRLVIKEALSGKTIEEMEIPGIPAFSNPTWSPDGKSIVFAGSVDGQIDLYQFFLKNPQGSANKKLIQLTDDRYAEMQPNWSFDGKKLVFATDQISLYEGTTHGKYTANIAVMDFETKEITHLDIFRGADNLNPVFDPEGNIYFLSNHDGFRNIYKYDFATEEVFKKTDLLTGVSGITAYSPALSVSKKRDKVLFSHYFKGSYTIFQIKPEKLLNQKISPDSIDFAAATLPVTLPGKKDIVNPNLAAMANMPNMPESSFNEKKYESKFRLDYIGGGGGIGIGNNRFSSGTTLAGGVDMLFSDILGNNQLYTGISMNGEVYDFGGQVIYVNRKKKLAWGASISHIPYRTGFQYFVDTATVILSDGTPILTDKVNTDLLRIFEDGVTLFGHYPFSTTKRIEASVGANYRYFRLDRYTDYYSGYYSLLQQHEKVKVGDAINIGGLILKKGVTYSTDVAFVGDNSFFGIASPMQGYRYRLGIEKYFGLYDYFSLLGDFRKYHFIKPVSLAIRGMHYGRYGNDANNFYPIYLGQMGLVRGYNYGSLVSVGEDNLSFNQLTGSKIFVSNFEIRLPFTGPERLALLKSKYFFSELALFLDGGIAWDSFDDFKLGNENVPTTNKPIPIFSSGVSMRINLFGALIVEPYFAIPFTFDSKYKVKSQGTFGINIVPGW